MVDKSDGLKRIRGVASLIATGVFSITAIGQFRGQPIGYTIMGVLISAIVGFGAMWILLTIVIYLVRLFRR